MSKPYIDLCSNALVECQNGARLIIDNILTNIWPQYKVSLEKHFKHSPKQKHGKESKRMNAEDVARSLLQLSESREDLSRQKEEAAKLPTPPDSDEEDVASDATFHAFIGDASDINERLLRLTNFTLDEFCRLHKTLEDCINDHFSSRRGKRGIDSPKDLLFMLLVVLKHGGEWGFLATMFNRNVSTFEKSIMRFIDVILDSLMDRFFLQVRRECTMRVLTSNQMVFSNFPTALYACDVKFHHTNRPRGSMRDVKAYFSGKHKLYGYKTEVSVAPNGMAIYASEHVPAAVSDIEIFKRNIRTHRQLTLKDDDEKSIADPDSLENDAWAILFDKGYVGCQQLVRAFIPKKKPIRGSLSTTDKIRNGLLSSDRVIVENWFGRLVSLWGIMFKQYRWSEGNYDTFFALCLCLTNFHILLHPLRHKDGDMAEVYAKKIFSLGTEKAEQHRGRLQKYRRNRQRRLSIMKCSSLVLAQDNIANTADGLTLQTDARDTYGATVLSPSVRTEHQMLSITEGGTTETESPH